jgi:hypothetical protein
MLSCREATELMSQEQDRPLTLGERDRPAPACPDLRRLQQLSRNR